MVEAFAASLLAHSLNILIWLSSFGSITGGDYLCNHLYDKKRVKPNKSSKEPSQSITTPDLKKKLEIVFWTLLAPGSGHIDLGYGSRTPFFLIIYILFGEALPLILKLDYQIVFIMTARLLALLDILLIFRRKAFKPDIRLSLVYARNMAISLYIVSILAITGGVRLYLVGITPIINSDIFSALIQVIAILFALNTLIMFFFIEKVESKIRDAIRANEQLAKEQRETLIENRDTLKTLIRKLNDFPSGQDQKLMEERKQQSEKLESRLRNQEMLEAQVKQAYDKFQDSKQKIFNLKEMISYYFKQITIIFSVGVVITIVGMILPAFEMGYATFTFLIFDGIIILFGSLLIYAVWRNSIWLLETVS
jgi:hypothetical protein